LADASVRATEVRADLNSSVVQPKVILASAAVARPIGNHTAQLNQVAQPRAVVPHAHPVQAKNYPVGDYVVQSEQVVVTMTSDRVNRAGQPVWQVHMWQVRVLVPVNQSDKNIPRKNI
jgi:hypothetical protein